MGCGFLYYIPGLVRPVKREHLLEHGLGYAFELIPTPNECVGGGPDGARGFVVADDRFVPANRIGYFADRQTWRQIPGSKAWCGFYNDTPPGPGDCARNRQLVGHSVNLANETSWTVPVARAASETDGELRYAISLPTSIGVADDGTWQTGGVVPKYAALWDVACRWWDQAIAGIKIEAERAVLEFDGMADGALLALQTNYRIGKAEVALLGLFDDRCMFDVLGALVDWPTIAEFVKKKVKAEP